MAGIDVEKVARIVEAVVPEGEEVDLSELLGRLIGEVKRDELVSLARALMGKMGVVWDARVGRFIVYKPRNPAKK